MTLNRTTLELKSRNEKNKSSKRPTLNRTTLELKFVKLNQLFALLVCPQSHHTGIEISYTGVEIDQKKIPQSHHTGIEINENLCNVKKR